MGLEFIGSQVLWEKASMEIDKSSQQSKGEVLQIRTRVRKLPASQHLVRLPKLDKLEPQSKKIGAKHTCVLDQSSK